MAVAIDIKESVTQGHAKCATITRIQSRYTYTHDRPSNNTTHYYISDQYIICHRLDIIFEPQLLLIYLEPTTCSLTIYAAIPQGLSYAHTEAGVKKIR